MSALQIKLRKLVLWFLVVVVVVFILVSMQKRGEMRLMANRMIKDEKIVELVRHTEMELLTGRALVRLEYSFDGGIVEFASRSEDGVIVLRDRLRSMRLSIEPEVGKKKVVWRCRAADAVIFSTIDCDVLSD